jgi:DNA polymerase elongation subunit (family B)
MIISFDIETIANHDAVAIMPPPEVKTGNIKDPSKIAEKVAEAKREQTEKAALDPLTARVVCYSAVGFVAPSHEGMQEHVEIIKEASDEEETKIIQSIFRVLGEDETRIVTWNGIGFDLPMIYKRAMILDINPGNFGTPPLSVWTKRYSTERHYDLMQIWGGWNSNQFAKLDTVARMVLGERKNDFDVTTLGELIKTEEGRDAAAKYCLQDANLTWLLWTKFNGTLFN